MSSMFRTLSKKSIASQLSRSIAARGWNTSAQVLSPTNPGSKKLFRDLGSNDTTMKPFFSTQAASSDQMFCRQCEQTQDGIACKSAAGICGKTALTAACQDVLVHVIKQVSIACVEARAKGITVPQEVNVWTMAAAFSTLTNVNFSEARIVEYITEGHGYLKQMEASGVKVEPNGAFQNATSISEVEAVGPEVSVTKRSEDFGHEDAFSLNEIATYGMKGLSAYAMHVHQLRVAINKENPSAAKTLPDDIFEFIHETWAKLASSEPDVEGLLGAALKVGENNGKVMAALDEAHAELLGTPEPTEVRTTPVEGKCILISGHDMVDLYHLLKQTEGTGIQVYTHGEMLPAHAYPNLKKFSHLAGNYGTAWQNQNFEFASFPGPIIVTTNCIVKPRKAYQDRIYTMNEVGYDGVQHIGADRDYSAVIAKAQSCKGFKKTVEPSLSVMTGFNHRAVLPLAGQIIEAAQNGSLSRIFLIGGCDGSQWSRSYFTDLAEEVPDDSLILTLGCAKNRMIHSSKFQSSSAQPQHSNSFTLPNGTVIPRVLDMGQCNDSYSAVVVATELAKALDCSVNDLPLSLALSHLEQKAAAVLLTLLSLGVKNIRLGPSLPAYVSPGVLKILVDTYGLKPIGDSAEEDLENMMKGQ